MSKTVVSLFRSTKEAQNVKHELVNAGYSAGSIQVVAEEGSSDASASTTSKPTETGFGATVSNFFRSLTGGNETERAHYTEGLRQGGALLSVTVENGQEQQVADLLESYGGRDVDEQTVATTPAVDGSAGGTVSVVQEEMVVGKRQVQRGGVRIYSHLIETPVEESIRLREEHVHVDRLATSRPATEADFTAFKEGTIELTETAEEAIVSKNARVVEEIVVGKQTSESTQTIRDSVRHTEVEVEQLGTVSTTAVPRS